MSFVLLNNPLIVPQSAQDKKEAKPALMDKPTYLPNARMTVKGKVKDRKKIIDISDIVGSAEDINKRLQEQIEGPKAMFSEDGPVSRSLICCNYCCDSVDVNENTENGRPRDFASCLHSNRKQVHPSLPWRKVRAS